ncbi:MAG: Npt1/Npt2 family nucleotide transporter [Acidobacteriota bacterium]
MKNPDPQGKETKRQDAVVSKAMLVAAAMIASHVAGLATRDALFLSNYDITALPMMLIGASVFSLSIILVVSRAMPRLSPHTLVPHAFSVSAGFLLMEWGLLFVSPRAAAVAVYLHLAVVGSFLISGFWSMINEEFDPRTARQRISSIAGGATVGGLIGGLLAERVAVILSVSAMLPILGLIHLFCAWNLRSFSRHSGPVKTQPIGSRSEAATETHVEESGLQILRRDSYLRGIAVLVLLGALGKVLLDYVFKAQASAVFSEPEELLRFFAAFYTLIGLITFMLQTALSRISLEKLGLAKTVAMLPSTLVAGALSALFFPGLGSAAAARAGEGVVRSSLFRSGYELLYTPVPPRQKRATKPLIDVGFEGLGDALGGGTVRLILMLGAQWAHSVMLITSAVLAGLALLVARRLHQGYVQALEKSLLEHAVVLDLAEVDDKTTRQTLIQTMASVDLRALGEMGLEPESGLQKQGPEEGSELLTQEESVVSAGLEEVVAQVVNLRSGDPESIHRVLNSPEELEPAHVPHVIPLLAWDQVCRDAIRSLQQIAPAITGQLIDALIDPQEDFAIRRRIPRVLSASPSQRAAAGLWMGLEDKRFEVRFQCGQALAKIVEENSKVHFDREVVFDRVGREVAVDRRVWESHKLLDQLDAGERDAPLVDEFLRKRTSRSLEHVFNLLSLALPREPLKIALRGLYTDDISLRGTALEYLESILPGPIREGLWLFLEDDRREKSETGNREQILADLMRSNQSIELNLAELRRKSD